jgi:hypothetical protein
VYWFSYLVFRDRTAPKVEPDRDPSRNPPAAVPETEASSVNPAPPGA